MSITLARTVLLMGGIAMVPAAALSQTPMDSKDTAKTASSDQTGEIVVTAQKRSEAVSKVPISITAESQAQMDKQGLRSITDIARTVPGLNFRSDNDLDQPSISIRGISSIVGSSTTGIYIDETPTASRNICSYCGFSAFPKLFDLDRVEVLRGPQGTLFGAGSEGGTIRFITPAPGLEQYSGYARSEIGFTDNGAPSYEIGAAVGGPIETDTLGFRLALWTRHDGGYIDLVDRNTGDTVKNNSNDGQSYVARLAVTWKPTSELTITPSFFFQRDHTDARSYYWEEAGFLKSYNRLQPVTDSQYVGALNIGYTGDGFTVKSITSYYYRKQSRLDDFTGTYLAFYAGRTTPLPNLPDFTADSHLITAQRNITQELRVATDASGPLSFTGGLYFSHAKTSFLQHEISDLNAFSEAAYGITALEAFGYPDYDGANYYDSERQTDREYAAFGEVGYSITSKLKISVGGRVSRSDFTLDSNRQGPLASGPYVAQNKGSSTPFTPRARISYDMGQTLVYASAGKGFRVGGGNTAVPQTLCGSDLSLLGMSNVPSTYKPDSLWSYEVGAKTRTRDGKLRLSGSAFWINWNNIQTNIVLPYCGYTYVSNAGKARSRGFELEGAFTLITGLTVSGNVAYTDAEYTKSIAVGSTFIITSGTPLSVPKWTARAIVEYSLQTESGLEPYIHGDYQYNAAYTRGFSLGTISYDPDINHIGALNQLNLRAGVRRGGIDLSVYVNNLANNRTILNRYHDLIGLGLFRASVLRPRTIGATGTYRF